MQSQEAVTGELSTLMNALKGGKREDDTKSGTDSMRRTEHHHVADPNTWTRIHGKDEAR